MRFSPSATAAIALAVSLAACAGGGGRTASTATALASPQGRLALRDVFVGRASGASGRVRGDKGKVTVELRPGRGQRVRGVTVTFTAPSCPAQRRCLRLAGVLTGKLAEAHGIPDVGRSFAVSARGAITPLASVSAAGTATGVGNVRFGHESLRLTLTSRLGSVLVSAASAQVPAFTSP
ncbi:MAG TPA: hypothetical protein VG388_02925 [Solirubrobacteraceae bacterium]|jgi:hypothetical protein|nr:hypothetical protein [Solirubrobacteraceae bacterium]